MSISPQQAIWNELQRAHQHVVQLEQHIPSQTRTNPRTPAHLHDPILAAYTHPLYPIYTQERKTLLDTAKEAIRLDIELKNLTLQQDIAQALTNTLVDVLDNPRLKKRMSAATRKLLLTQVAAALTPAETDEDEAAA